MGLLSQTMEMAMGTLNLKKGVMDKTASICMGIGIKPQKRPMSTPFDIDLRLMDKYSRGILYLSINLSSLLFLFFLLKTLRIID
jgi:hypothetical protein